MAERERAGSAKRTGTRKRTGKRGEPAKTVTASITFTGKDRTGVVARVTQYLFEQGGNIESLEEQVSRGFFHMALVASWPWKEMRAERREDVTRGLEKVGREVRMEARVRFHKHGERQRMALFVTKEAHCLDAILKRHRARKLPADPVVVIGNHADLKPLATDAGLPFHHVPFVDRAESEARALEILDAHDVDFLVLARFMKILSPPFCWRYRNKIINVHPSLLPAFPGAMAYRQAWEHGVQVVGATAHFVTPSLDQGPIITQDAVRVKPEDPLERLVTRGRKLESKVLLEAIDLYVKKRLDVHWGRVWRR